MVQKICDKTFRRISRQLVLSECRILRARIALEKAQNAYRGAAHTYTEEHRSINHFSKKLLKHMQRDALKKGKGVVRARKDLLKKLTMERKMIKESQNTFYFLRSLDRHCFSYEGALTTFERSTRLNLFNEH